MISTFLDGCKWIERRAARCNGQWLNTQHNIASQQQCLHLCKALGLSFFGIIESRDGNEDTGAGSIAENTDWSRSSGGRNEGQAKHRHESAFTTLALSRAEKTVAGKLLDVNTRTIVLFHSSSLVPCSRAWTKHGAGEFGSGDLVCVKQTPCQVIHQPLSELAI